MNHQSASESAATISSEQWFQWLSKAQEALLGEYLLRDGRRLVSDFRHENSIVREYVGREVLELLQNAGDAAADAEVEGEVAIHVLNEGLVIANTGAPFTQEGVDSLQTANLSPKKGGRRSMIGEKGLGFRAVLNWTDAPLIDSGHLRIVFSRSYADKMFEQLLTSSEELASRIEKERSNSEEVILPTLAFPAFGREGILDGWFDTREQRTVAAKCGALREEEYDTAIGMPFRKPKDFEVAKQQLDELRPEILLFVSSLQRISIQIQTNRQPRVWQRKLARQNSFQVTENGQLLGEWVTFSSGVQPIPEEHRDETADQAKNYELVVAIPGEASLEGNPLFTYFPTEVILPLPIVCHATLQLDESRKHPTVGRTNRYILTKLAETVADIAEERTSDTDPWAGLRLVCALGDYPVELKRVEFAQTLRSTASSKRLVPTLDGQFRRSSEALLLKAAKGDWIPVRLFPEVVRYPENEEEWNLLSALEIQSMSAEEFAQRLSGETLAEEERIALIAGIVRNRIPEEFHLSGLLIDSSGARVERGVRVFLSPSGEIPEVPEWVSLRFLSKGLRERLQRTLGTSEQRELQRLLSAFGVVEFAQASLIQSVVAEANRRCEETPDNEGAIRSDLLRFLFRVFRAATEDEEEVGKFPPNAGIRIFNQTGTYAPARNLNLAQGYGVSGSINQGLFDSWAPERLVASADELGIEGSEDELASFLKWVGVAEFPREERKSPGDRAFRDFVVSSLVFPARFEDYVFNNAEEVSGLWIEESSVIDDLVEILESASPAAILGWIAADPRWDEWRQRRGSHCRLTARKGGDRNYRSYYGPVSSYISWKVSSTAWLPTSTGELRAPGDCLIASKHIEVLFPRPADLDSDVKRCVGLVTMNDLYRAWERAGVLPGLDRLELDQIYGLLLAMPEKSPDGKAARALSRWLLENTDIVFGLRGSNCSDFAKNGKMWGEREGDEGFFPITELWHRDSESFPKEILKQLAIVDLPTRVGAKRVERLFHVRSLGDATISQEVASHRVAPMSKIENDRFQEAKLYLKRLRESQSTNAENLAALDRLELTLCDQLTVKLAVEGKESETEIKDWESVLEGDRLFVKTSCEEGDTVSRDLLTDSIGSALAVLFGLTNGDAFAKLCRCHSKDRAALLRRMCGEESLAGLVSIDEAEAQLRHIPIHRVHSSTEVGDQSNGEDETVAEEIEIDPEEVNATEEQPSSPGEIEGLEVTPAPHTPSEPRLPRKMVIRRTPTAGGCMRHVRRVTDGDLCERLAFIFEIEQGRFPIAMGNITGIEGAGCDIFSFCSQEARLQFETNVPRDMTLVSRFIEVKGRGDSEAKIDLRGNEYVCARERAERYFLYRVYESGDGSYFLTALQDPLQQMEAISHAVVVNLDAAENSLRFELRPVSQSVEAEPDVPDRPTGDAVG